MKFTATSTILAALLLGLAQRTSAQDDCTICDDVPTPKMEDKGQTCEDATNTIQNNCVNADNWIKNKFCRYSCSQAGLGYEDEEPCCADAPTDSLTTEAPTATGTIASNEPTVGGVGTLEPTATATGTTEEPTTTATGPKFTDEPTESESLPTGTPEPTSAGTGTEPTAAPVEAVLPEVPTSEPVASPEPTDSNATVIPTSGPTAAPLECPDGYFLDTFLPQPDGSACAVCAVSVVDQDNSTGTVLEAEEECVATCRVDTCNFVPEGCGVVVCPKAPATASPTGAPTVGETAAPTAAPTEGAEPTDAPSDMGPTSAADGRMSVMAVTAAVAAATLLWS